jgi:hypothetical protein
MGLLQFCPEEPCTSGLRYNIHIEGADPLYREIRVENTLKNDAGEEVKLKKGSHVEVTIEAEADATLPKKPKAAS